MNRRYPNRYNNARPGPSNMGLQNNQENGTFPQNRSLVFPQNHAPSPVRSGSCVLCKSSTVLVCQRCGDFYCSPNCQTKDWPKHRYICFQMPPLIHSSARLTYDMPSLNGFQNRELPPTVSAGGPQHHSQHRTWLNNDPTSPTPTQQQKQQQQQRPQQQQYQQQRQQQQQQFQPQKQKQQQQQPERPQQQQPERPQQQQPERPQQPHQEQKHQQQNQKPEINKKNERVDLGKIEQAPFPKTNSTVLLTAFRSSNRVFIRSIESEDNEGYCEVIKKINEYGKTAGPMKIMPSRNAFAITDFNNDNLYYRVQIIGAKNENEIKVVYYDFGNEATKKLSELKEISKECAQLKQYIRMVSLKNVPHVIDNDKLSGYLKSFEETEATIVYNEKEKPACEIIPWGVEESINKKINLFIQLLNNESEKEQKHVTEKVEDDRKQEPPAQNAKSDVSFPNKPSTESLVGTPSNASKKRPSQLTKPVMNPPFETVHLPVGQKNIDVMVVDNSLLLFGYFGCVASADRENLQSIQKHLSDYEDNGHPYKPKVEEYCLAKFEGCWYRAKALSILSEEYVEVVFIDFLNESQVSVKCIRRYPMDLDYPCKTSLCMIDDLPSELSDDIVDVLKEKLQPGTEHRINEVKGVDEDASDVFVVKMDQVAKWLKD